MTANSLTVSVVIPAYNETDTIEACLAPFFHQTTPADEIIVVNNLSTDDTVTKVRRLQRLHPTAHLHLIEQSKWQGIAATRNRGFDAAKSEIIGRLDADSVVDTHWVAEIKQAFWHHPEVAAITGPVVYHDMPLKKFGLHADDSLRQFMARLAPNYQILFGSNMAIRRLAWQQVRAATAIDPRGLLHEDIDLGLCLGEANLTIKYVSKLVGSMSARRLEDSPKDFRTYMRRFENTYKRHHITDLSLMVPPIIYLAAYFPLKAVRALYQQTTDKDD